METGTAPQDRQQLLRRSLDSDRIHSGYLLAGVGEAPRAAALEFVRGMVCAGEHPRPCETCAECRRSAGPEGDPIAIDGTGKKGPLFRHVGDHPDLLWVERGRDDTRVRIGQIRALQRAFGLRSSGEGRRAAVIADAEWLNVEAQNALLHLIEEPPPRSCIVLVAASSAGLLATVRSRCQKVLFPPETLDPLDDPEHAETALRIAQIGRASLPDLLDWAEEYRGARAPAAAGVQALLLLGSAYLRRRAGEAITEATPGEGGVRAELDAFHTLGDCRKSLAQRNANPQMVAERALLALRQACAR